MAVPIETITVAPCVVEPQAVSCVPRLVGDSPVITPPVITIHKIGTPWGPFFSSDNPKGKNCIDLKITPSGLITLGPGGSAQLSAVLFYSDGTLEDVTASANWSTLGAAIVAVTQKGFISAVSKGSSIVTVSVPGCNLSSSVTVNVDPLKNETCVSVPMQIVMALDASASMGGLVASGLDGFYYAREAAKALIASLKVRPGGTTDHTFLDVDEVSTLIFSGTRDKFGKILNDFAVITEYNDNTSFYEGYSSDIKRLNDGLDLGYVNPPPLLSQNYCGEQYGYQLCRSTDIGRAIQKAGTGGWESAGEEAAGRPWPYACGDGNGNGMLCSVIFQYLNPTPINPLNPDYLNSKKIMVLLTDGIENLETPAFTLKQANDAKLAGITLVVVGIGSNPLGIAFAKSLATSGYYFHVPSIDKDLGTIFGRIAYSVCKGPNAGAPVAPVIGGGPSETAALSGLRWQMPCQVPLPQFGGCTCTDPAPVSAVMGGVVGASYDAVVRIRGKVELKRYTKLQIFDPPNDVNGISDGPDSFVFRGGVAEETPFDSLYNRYSLEITGSQTKTIFLNAVPANLLANFGEVRGRVFILNYLVTVRIKQGDTVTLRAVSVDGAQLADTFGAPCVDSSNVASSCTVPAAPPAPNTPTTYVGQFLQMDVITVTPV